MEDGDFEFILKSWLRAHCHGSKEAQLAGRHYWTHHREIAMRILARAAVLVATWAKDPSVVAGFAVTEAGRVHFVYVRKSFWRMGIARRLLAGMLSQEGVVYTHRTHMIVGLLRAGRTWKLQSRMRLDDLAGASDAGKTP